MPFSTPLNLTAYRRGTAPSCLPLTICLVCSYLFAGTLLAQEKEMAYLAEHAAPVELSKTDHPMLGQLAENDIVLLGTVHGSAVNQDIDLWLIKSLHQRGFRNLVVEVSPDYGYFLNEYLATGEEKWLDHVMNNGYFRRTSQDASIELRNKWIAIKNFNDSLPEDERLRVFGVNTLLFADVAYLAHLVPDTPTGDPLVDSLVNYRYPAKVRKTGYQYWSTDPAKEGELPTSDYIPIDPAINYMMYWQREYKPGHAALFGDNQAAVEAVMNMKRRDKRSRDERMYERFERQVLPLLAEGEKVIISMGYAHAMQAPISGNKYLGQLLKENLAGKYSVASVVTELIDSEYLDRRQYKQGEAVQIKDITLHLKEYDGATTYSSEAEGEMYFQGKDLVRQLHPERSVVMYHLAGPASPFADNNAFVTPAANGAATKWKVDAGSSTTDYYQYLIVARGSEANKPFPLD